jgi:hypothetical protein
MISAHLLGREEVKAPLEGENSKWHHSLSQAKHIMHNVLTSQAALVAFLHNNPSIPHIRKVESHPPHLIFPL